MNDLIPIPSPGIPLEFGALGDPLVVVLHDGYGRLPWLEPYAAALADRGGFRVLVPDCYDGVATTEEDDATALMAALSDDDVRDILDAAIGQGLDEGSKRVGLVGFAMGGTLALQAAQRGDADAVVAYYATLTASEPGIVPCPVLLHLAETDDYRPGGSPDDFVPRLRGDGTPVSAHTYAGAGHLFANATLAERIDGRAAALAFARTTVFLESKLSDEPLA